MKTTFEDTHFAVRIATDPETVIEVRGELDLASVPIFRSAVREFGLGRRGRVVLDLRQLAFIDAAGLHAVLELHEESLNVSAAMTILPGPRNVQRVFELAGVGQLMPFSSLGSPAATLLPDTGAIDRPNQTNSKSRLPSRSRSEEKREEGK
jgi:anti-anti-sigma factor